MNEQELFWSGSFGDAYTVRNDCVSFNNLSFFINIFSFINDKSELNSLLEIGCNNGCNLKAIHMLRPKMKLTGVDINNYACSGLEHHKWLNVINASIFDDHVLEPHDIVLCKGFLIHINPNDYDIVFEKIYNSSNKYIIIAEYYSKICRPINYRTFDNKLWSNDFFSEFKMRYNDIQLVEYGFVYHRDEVNPQDDLTWFLIKKVSSSVI